MPASLPPSSFRSTASRGHRRLGLLDGKFQIPDDFNTPLPDSVIRTFEGRKR